MAEVALTSIAKSALSLFTSLAKDEALLLWNSPAELQRLQATFDTIIDLLHDADKLQSEEKAVLSCLSRLRSVMYDAEDLFDSLASEALRKRTMSGGSFSKEVRLFFSRSNQLALLSKTAHKVKSIKKSLDHVKADMGFCEFRVRQPSVVQQVLRFDRVKTHSFVHQEDVIGREEDRERIVTMLLHGPSHGGSYSVVSVIGFGGLGKTTLAQLVYRDERVRKEFDLCLWTCINDLTDLEQVLIEIIASEGVRHHELGLEKLQENLREMLGGKKFLLVIDDLWDENYSNWDRLDGILRCGVSGKVLVTTRSTKVVECFDVAKSSCIDLAVLSEKNAWSLFVKKAFSEGEIYDPGLEELGKQIVSRCGYVPLAITVVGSLLRRRKRDVRIWSDFLDKELGRVLLGGGSDKFETSISDVLVVSYRDLHPNLKLCFAYCSLFPKGYVFEMHGLIRLWISQGFVNTNGDNKQSLEELGETYFFNLVDRCFFQLSDAYSPIKVKMHDLIHDLAIKVAKTDMKLLDKDHIKSGERVSLRHISMHPEIDASFDYCKLVSNPSRVRTILFHWSYQIRNISHGSFDMFLTSYKMLRTLSFSSFGIETISDSIGELVHLRYLDLSGSRNLRHLPNSICKIHHLLFLNLKDCSKLEKLPTKIGKLVSLRQLRIGGCRALESLPEGLATLTSLVDLDRLIVNRESGGLRYLKNLNNLSGFLHVELPQEGWPNAVEDAKRSNMSEKHKLKSLIVSWNRKSAGGSIPTHRMAKDEAEAVLEALEPSKNLEQLEIQKYGGQKLPNWFSMIKNVKELSLSEFDHVEYLEDEMNENSGFASLETLRITGMKKLKGWWRHEMLEESRRPHLDKVRSLSIYHCRKLKGKMPLLMEIEELNLTSVDVQWVQGLMTMNTNKLEGAYLCDIKGLVCLPEEWIRHLNCLERLRVVYCRDLKWVSRCGLVKLTSLKCLEIGDFKCVIRDEDEDNTKVEEGMPWKALQRLSSLRIPVSDTHLQKALGNLTLLEDLVIRKWVNKEDFVLPSKALQNLHTVWIGFERDRTCDLRQTRLHNLPLLKKLHIEGCKELHICWALVSNMKLKDLTLKNVRNVIGVEDQQSQSCALTITTLYLEGTGKWVHDIPWESLASLTRLRLEDCMGEMEEDELLIPDQIQHLSSLQYLYITRRCEQVRSIPKWFPLLKSLKGLSIDGCSEILKRRCEKENGEDWPLISHITGNISIIPRTGSRLRIMNEAVKRSGE